MQVGQDRTQQDRAGQATGQAARAARGENHARACRAIGALLLAAMLLLAAPPAAAQVEENPLVQRGIPAEATAENAVVARDRALASGQRIAYERMAAQLGLPRSIPDSQIEAMVASLVIESERITPRGYTARITVNFNPPSVARLPATPAPGTPGAQASGPVVATIEAVASYRSLGEYLEITRRLNAAPAVSRVRVVTVAGDMARLNLGLRSSPGQVAAELGGAGLTLAPADAPPGMAADPRLAGAWRLGLAGWR